MHFTRCIGYKTGRVFVISHTRNKSNKYIYWIDCLFFSFFLPNDNEIEYSYSSLMLL